MGRNEARRRNAEAIIRLFTQLTAATTWQRVEEVKLAFRTYHPQGLVKIRDSFYVSSVEIVTLPEKCSHLQNGYDRTPGEGIGHLFQFDSTGKLIKTITVREGTIYHPGGIDYDGEYIWMPVAEYRPHSQSVIYRVVPETLDISEIFRWNDHIGGLAYNRWDDTLHGISWGSRTFYDWTPEEGSLWNKGQPGPEGKMYVNGSHYIDYQDCQFLEEKYMVCSGLHAYALPNIGWMSLGGLELIDLESHIAIHQIPVVLYSGTMRPMTQNPFFVELHHGHLRFYFIPDDHESTLYIYDAVT
jgi:hypothetical protein